MLGIVLMNKRGIDLPDNISILRISGTGMTIVTCFLMSVKKGTWNNRKKILKIQAVQDLYSAIHYRGYPQRRRNSYEGKELKEKNRL